MRHMLSACLAVAVLTTDMAPVHAQRRSAAAERVLRVGRQLQALGGAMPESFDIVPADPCSGRWEVTTDGKQMDVTTFRYRQMPAAHLRLPGNVSVNLVVRRLEPHTVAFDAGPATFTMQCLTATAEVDVAEMQDGRWLRHRAIGRIAAGDEAQRQATAAAVSATPLHAIETASTDECAGQPPRKTSGSLDGGFTYVQLCRAATTDVIVQISNGDGRRRDVTYGNSLSVIRNGPWRGMLLVSKHKYKAGGGSYDATWVIRPDGKEMFQVPGTENGDDGQVRAWLMAHGWTAD